MCGRVNFTNLSRYSHLSERTYRRQFKKGVEFAALNRVLIEQVRQADGQQLAVMDCVFVAKSGKTTFGLDWFWNGCASQVEKGLELSVVGVVDVDTPQGYALSAQQTFAQENLPECSRMDQYLEHLRHVRPHLPADVRYLAVDGEFAKEAFVAGTVRLNLQVISKLRRDANLRWLYTGERTHRRGRPRKYDGKVDLTDLSRFTWVASLEPEIDLYTAVVWHVSLKRKIRIAYLVNRSHATQIRTCLLFSTDLEQDPLQLVEYYKLRFQIEFVFRDAKQFTGLEDCQARDIVKLDFHFNASLTALNLAKLEALQQHSGTDPFVFSMASTKRRSLNRHLIEQFICNFELEPSAIKSHPNYETLCNYGSIAA